MFAEKTVKTKKGISLFTENLGNPDHPAVLLIMGAMNQGLFWYDAFCESLERAGRYVIRYDHRDTGKSSVIDYSKNPYNLEDMTRDAQEILDAYGVGKADIIGLSMGGYISQLLGVHHPGRVRSLTLISTTADHRPYMEATAGNFTNQYGLPYPQKIYLDYIEKGRLHPPQNETEMDRFQIEGWRILFHQISEGDFAEVERLVRASNKRSVNRFAAFNHGPAVAASPPRTDMLKDVSAPVLIIHGKEDPCFPPEHGRLLHRTLAGSRLEEIENMGHMFSPSQGIILSDTINRFLEDIR